MTADVACIFTFLSAPGKTGKQRGRLPSSPANIVIAALLPSQGITGGKARLPAGEQQPHVWYC